MNELRSMHLFSGIGGGLLADLILGHKPIVAIEWDKYACQVLRERAADGWFPDLSVWEGDVRLFDPSEYAGRVDCIHAGFPCQPFSNAGLRKGSTDSRGDLFAEVLRCVEVIRPKHIFLENVPGLLTSRSPTCICGWPYRRGGLHSHSQTSETNNLDIHSHSADEYVQQGDSNSGRNDKDVRGEILSCGINSQGMGESMAMAYQRGYSQRVSDEDIAIFDAQKNTGRIGDTTPQIEVEPTDSEEWDSMLESGSKGIGSEDERTDARVEQEGARCPKCGRGLVQPDTRHIWYLDSIQWSLAALGYSTEWLCIRASDVGAPHGRDRWFCLGNAKSEQRNGRHNNTRISLERWTIPKLGNSSGSPELADSHNSRCLHGQAEIQPAEGRLDALGESRSSGEDVAYTSNTRLHGCAIAGNDGADRKESRNQQSAGRSSGVEWYETEPNVGRVANGVSSRVDKLKGLGNAQVPIQAAAAFRLLHERLEAIP